MPKRLADGEPLNLAEYDQPEWSGPPKRSYLICSSQRSGSNYYCALLLRQGVFGVPFEYFNTARRDGGFGARLGISPGCDTTAYLTRVIRHRTSPNGVFGAKVHASQMIDVLRSGAVQKLLPGVKFIYLRRADVFAQAVSFAIARQTDQWTSHGDIGKEPVYDPDLLRDCLNGTMTANAQWTQFFAANRIQPLSLTYEGIQADPMGAVRETAKFLDVSVGEACQDAPLLYARQGDDRNIAWAKRLRATCIADGTLKAGPPQ